MVRCPRDHEDTDRRFVVSWVKVRDGHEGQEEYSALCGQVDRRVSCQGLSQVLIMLGRKCLSSGPFRELPAIVISLTASTQTWHRFTAFQILANCPLLFFMCDKDNSVSSEEIAGFILGGMTDSSIDTRIEAIKALSKMMLHDGDIMRGDTSCRSSIRRESPVNRRADSSV
jgi:hypothetical protein